MLLMSLMIISLTVSFSKLNKHHYDSQMKMNITQLLFYELEMHPIHLSIEQMLDSNDVALKDKIKQHQRELKHINEKCDELSVSVELNNGYHNEQKRVFCK